MTKWYIFSNIVQEVKALYIEYFSVVSYVYSEPVHTEKEKKKKLSQNLKMKKVFMRDCLVQFMLLWPPS